MTKQLLRTALLASAVGLPLAAHAAPALSILAYDNTGGTTGTNGTQIALTPTTNSNSGFQNQSGGDSNFTNVSVTSSGAANAAGGLSTTTLDISAASNTILTIFVTQTGLTPMAVNMPFALTFTLNGLTTLDGTGSASFTDFVDTNNVAFGRISTTAGSTSPTAEQLNTTFTATNTTTGTQQLNANATGLTGLYSETQRIVLTFNTAGTITASSQMKPVPEPSSIAMLGVGLLGLGMIGLRRGRRNDA